MKSIPRDVLKKRMGKLVELKFWNNNPEDVVCTVEGILRSVDGHYAMFDEVIATGDIAIDISKKKCWDEDEVSA